MSKAHSRDTLIAWRSTLKNVTPLQRSTYTDGLTAAQRQKLWYSENKHKFS
jgi:hypothetical protein